MIKKLADVDDDDDDDDEESSEEDTKDTTHDQEHKEEKSSSDSDDENEEDKQKRIQAKKDKFKEFWKEFGQNIKLGIIEDSANRQKLAKISRWYSSKNINELISFDTYLERAKAGQESIYFIAGENRENLMNHPTL